LSDSPEFIFNHWRLDNWYPDLGPAVLKSLKTYYDELVKFNKTLNMVPPKTIPMADVLHFGDGIAASRVIAANPIKFTEIYDLGSGAGFPGLIFGILYPSIKVNLVESDQKKSEFLKHIIAALKITNVAVMTMKVEDLKEGSVGFAMARGFSTISRTILLMRKTILKGGIIFHIKGEEWGMEVSQIPIQLCSSWAPGLAGEYRLPVGEVRFAVIKTDKIS
jgi:16S rRNA (guanine527-N7)-methyltransferase